MSNVFNLMSDLRELANPVQAKNLQRFFAPKAHLTRSGKTIIGGYGQNDKFLGLKVPQVRSVCNKYWKEINLDEAVELLHSKYHEMRQCALFILVKKFQKADKVLPCHSRADMSLSNIDIGNPEKKTGSPIGSGMTPTAIKEEIFRIYITNTKYINNWDLVDLTAGKIVGAYLDDKPKDLLYKFAKSKNLWERRIAIIATSYYIGKGESQETIKIAKILLHDPHDLIHTRLPLRGTSGQEAVGWMLREVGKRCETRPPCKPARRCGQGKILTDFLDQHAHEMPRTMLRYAIERLNEKTRKYYLNKDVPSIKPDK